MDHQPFTELAYSCTDHVTRSRSTLANDNKGLNDQQIPQPSTSRLRSSLTEQPFDTKQFVEEAASKPRDQTVLYLAYGSNLSAEKFRGARNVKPLAQINVQVPSLRLTFDLAGIPYSEPCFANTARRDPYHDPPQYESTGQTEKTALLGESVNIRNGEKSWSKGLIGTVYEVTPQDYAHIIATEGGGTGYQDILVDCHPFASQDPACSVPQEPTLPAFKAHTLFDPIDTEGASAVRSGRGRSNHAQASARYLKLITDGAAECRLPYEYQDYLQSLHAFTITSLRQQIGRLLFLAAWGPLIFLLFTIGTLLTDENGRLPPWIGKLRNACFGAAWVSYDYIFRPVFGDGERTIGDDDNTLTEGRRRNQQRRNATALDMEKGSVLSCS